MTEPARYSVAQKLAKDRELCAVNYCAADPKRHFGAVIGMNRQGLKRFLGKELQRSVPGRVVDMQIGLLFEPPPGYGPKVFEVLEVSSI